MATGSAFDVSFYLKRRLKLYLFLSFILTHSNMPTCFVLEVLCIFTLFLMDRVLGG